MKKWICLLLALMCLFGIVMSASAEKGFETLYELFVSEEVFDEPDSVGEGEPEAVCFALFFFDPEYDITHVMLIGVDENGVGKRIQWQTDYEPGAQVMTFLVTRFAELKSVCEEGVDFCIAYSFDDGQTMNEIDTLEAAQQLMSTLQDTAVEQGDTESAETVQELLNEMEGSGKQ